MSEVEKQESQKTVVAFITGLLIGGLLVWVFSSTPTEVKAPEVEKEKTEETVKTETSKETTEKTDEMKKESTVEITGEGVIEVADQKAGTVVTLGDLSYPTKSGWVVVRDYKNETPGNILGAAFFDVDKGIMPTSVDLARATVEGNAYHVSFYTNEGTMDFELANDTMIPSVMASFTATK